MLQSAPPDYFCSYCIRHSEVSVSGALKPQYLFDFLQETAAAHALLLGCGIPFLKERKLAWVISMLKIEYFGHPVQGDELQVHTWCSGLDRLFATREFEWSVNGKPMGRASSRWLVIATDSFRPKKPEAVLEVPLPEPIAPPFFTDFDKIPRRETTFPIRYRIGDSQIDFNRHLNNAEYAAFVQDWLCEARGVTPDFRSMRIHFLADLKRGETVEVAGSLDGNSFYIEGVKPDGVCCFQTLGTLGDTQ